MIAYLTRPASLMLKVCCRCCRSQRSAIKIKSQCQQLYDESCQLKTTTVKLSHVCQSWDLFPKSGLWLRWERGGGRRGEGGEGPSQLIAITRALEERSNTPRFVLRRFLISPQYCHLVINEALLLLQPHREPGLYSLSNPYSDVERIIVQNSHSIMSHQHQLILSSGRKVRAHCYYYSKILLSINNPGDLINTFIN